MDRTGSQRRLGNHRLPHRVLVQRRHVVVDVHRRHVDGDVGDRHRSDQRHALHVPRLGDQRRRHRHSIGNNVGDPAHRARCTDRVDGDTGFDPSDPVVDRTGRQRRLSNHRLPRRVLVQRRHVVVDVHRRHVDRDVDDGHRSDQRHALHVPRLGDQRRRHRHSIGDRHGNTEHRRVGAQCADRTRRRPRVRPRWPCRGPHRQPTAAHQSPTTSSSTRPTAARHGRRSPTPRRP